MNVEPSAQGQQGKKTGVFIFFYLTTCPTEIRAQLFTITIYLLTIYYFYITIYLFGVTIYSNLLIISYQNAWS